ncbi:RNA polymerase sigma-70 factor [Niastella sp. OAS944]|uniref:RNA polymerase sigma-70 factor n=1 Tax=Niastella sp. OAS944 TaxID=2664089 RepID=UPI0034839255|nr:RNA polymerase sigma-70 factor (ECF subfamily) [Chitinophagaceae bacterium OAS944]
MEAFIFEADYQRIKVAIPNTTITMKPLSADSEQEFEQLFKDHFKSLYAYAFTILKNEAIAEETVQNVFYKIWEKKVPDNIQTSLKAYLYKAVYHESLNYLKHQKIKARYQLHVMQQTNNHNDHQGASRKILVKELEEKLRDAMNALPQQCRTIFQLSRFEGLKYQEIADQLGISVKTVENQMGKALKQLRVKLIDYLPIFLVALFYI